MPSLRSDASSLHFHKTLCDLGAQCLGPAGLEQRVNSGKGGCCVIYHRASPSLGRHICKMAIKRQSMRLRGLLSDLGKESVCTGSLGNMLEMSSLSQEWQCMLEIPASEKLMKHLGLESSLGSRVRLSQKFKHNNVTKLPVSLTRSLSPAKASHMLSFYAPAQGPI